MPPKPGVRQKLAEHRIRGSEDPIERQANPIETEEQSFLLVKIAAVSANTKNRPLYLGQYFCDAQS